MVWMQEIWGYVLPPDDRAALEHALGLASSAELRDLVSYMIDPVPFETQHPSRIAQMVAAKALLREHDPFLYGYLQDIDDWREVCLVLDPGTDPPGVRNACISLAESHPVRRASLWRAFRAWRRSTDVESSEYARWRDASTSGSVPNTTHLQMVDGSWMTSERLSGQAADREFRKAWRWPWSVPDTYVVNLPIEGINECSSLHVIVEVPSGVFIDGALLRIHAEDGPIGRGLDDPATAHHVWLIDDDDERADRTHHYCPPLLVPPEGLEREFRSPNLRLVLRPTYHNGLRAGLNLSWLSCLLLFAFLAVVAWPHSGYAPRLGTVPEIRGSGFDANSIVALILIVPTVALGLLIRMEEHPLTKRVHHRIRTRLGLVALSLFVGAVAFAVGLAGDALANLLMAVLTLSVLCSGFSTYSAVCSWWRERSATSTEP